MWMTNRWSIVLKLDRKVEYALIALKHMSSKRQGELTTAKEISDTYGCSFDTTSRVMQILTQKGFLHSSQGATGGYIMLKDLSKISLYDLYSTLLGRLQLVKCISSNSCEIEASCNIVTPMNILNQHIVNLCKSLSLKNLLEKAPTTTTNSPFYNYKPTQSSKKPSSLAKTELQKIGL